MTRSGAEEEQKKALDFVFHSKLLPPLPPPFKENAFALLEDDFLSQILVNYTPITRRITLPIDHLITAEIFLVRIGCAANFEVRWKMSLHEQILTMTSFAGVNISLLLGMN
uniref:Uncharacterized protein n=1 Tax=Glossina pallidipes TaxID=7398 RepID=A0A1A9ZT67_GLOPL